MKSLQIKRIALVVAVVTSTVFAAPKTIPTLTEKQAAQLKQAETLLAKGQDDQAAKLLQTVRRTLGRLNRHPVVDAHLAALALEDDNVRAAHDHVGHWGHDTSEYNPRLFIAYMGSANAHIANKDLKTAFIVFSWIVTHEQSDQPVRAAEASEGLGRAYLAREGTAKAANAFRFAIQRIEAHRDLLKEESADADLDAPTTALLTRIQGRLKEVNEALNEQLKLEGRIPLDQLWRYFLHQIPEKKNERRLRDVFPLYDSYVAGFIIEQIEARSATPNEWSLARRIVRANGMEGARFVTEQLHPLTPRQHYIYLQVAPIGPSTEPFDQAVKLLQYRRTWNYRPPPGTKGAAPGPLGSRPRRICDRAASSVGFYFRHAKHLEELKPPGFGGSASTTLRDRDQSIAKLADFIQANSKAIQEGMVSYKAAFKTGNDLLIFAQAGNKKSLRALASHSPSYAPAIRKLQFSAFQKRDALTLRICTRLLAKFGDRNGTSALATQIVMGEPWNQYDAIQDAIDIAGPDMVHALAQLLDDEGGLVDLPRQKTRSALRIRPFRMLAADAIARIIDNPPVPPLQGKNVYTKAQMKTWQAWWSRSTTQYLSTPHFERAVQAFNEQAKPSK